jgi:hypothetical protein
VPFLPIIVSEYFPAIALLFAEIVNFELPDAVAGFGLNVAVTPEGSPATLSVTELLCPTAVNVTVRELLDLRLTVIDDGDEMVKSPGSGLTVSDREVV